MRYLRLAALVTALVATAGTTALASPRVVVREGLAYKPHEISISGDGDFWVRDLRWRSWGAKTAVADGRAVEQTRPSHVNHTYPGRVELSERTYCANLHRTVYRKIVGQILGPSRGVFGFRMLTVVWTCAGARRQTASDAGAAAGRTCSTSGLRPAGVTRSITARGTSCASARRMVRAWFQKLKAVPNSPCIWADGSTKPGLCYVRRWRCSSYHTVDGHTYPVTCVSPAGRREVHFVNKV